MPQKYTYNSRNAGFTFIEMLVVISIVGMLASIALGSLNSARIKARDSAQVHYATAIMSALEFYYDDHGHYPPYPSTPGLIYYVSSADPRWNSEFLPAIQPYLRNAPAGVYDFYSISYTMNPAGGDPNVDVAYWPAICLYPDSAGIIAPIKLVEDVPKNSFWQGLWAGAGIYVLGTGNVTDANNCY